MYQKIFEQYFHLKRNKYACYHLLGKKSLQLRPKLVKSVQKNLRLCHIKAVFQSPSKLHLLFRFKDTLDEKILSDLFVVMRVGDAMLLIMVKPTGTFLQELHNMWVFQI